MNRPALLKRFPKLRTRVVSDPVLPAGTAQNYPSLADDIALLDSLVGPEFQRCDRAALGHQNRYRGQQVVLIVGATLLSGLGGLQAVFPGQSWPGFLLTVLGLALAAIGQTGGELRTFERFLEERVKAERLRAMYFRYLSRTGRYATPQREAVVRRAVVAVKAGEEPR